MEIQWSATPMQTTYCVANCPQHHRKPKSWNSKHNEKKKKNTKQLKSHVQEPPTPRHVWRSVAWLWDYLEEHRQTANSYPSNNPNSELACTASLQNTDSVPKPIPWNDTARPGNRSFKTEYFWAVLRHFCLRIPSFFIPRYGQVDNNDFLIHLEYNVRFETHSRGTSEHLVLYYQPSWISFMGNSGHLPNSRQMVMQEWKFWKLLEVLLVLDLVPICTPI